MFKKIKKSAYFKIIFLTILLFSFLFLSSYADSPDSIAIRIVPNPKHYSAMRWYLENVNKKGNPISLQVNNYRAIKDGRTVYVNIANLKNNEFYTNIFIISFNQNAEQATKKIISQIINNLKFNTNNSATKKAKIIRDTRRMADLVELRLLINHYYQQNGYYPQLKSGSYLPHRSISVWPSWRKTLSNELGTVLPIDPLNKLGECDSSNDSCNKDNFEASTCWDNKDKCFGGAIPLADSGERVTLPSDSYVYVYRTNDDGSVYNVCAKMELDINKYTELKKFDCITSP